MRKTFHETFTVISDSRDISDNGRVRMGNTGPAFQLIRPLVRGKPVTISDTGEVQIGDYSAANSSGSDEPKVRIEPVRSR